MQNDSVPERFVHCSERIVLDCLCGESLILIGFEEDWKAEHKEFVCECGAKLTLANRRDGAALDIKSLIQGSIRAPGTL